MQRRRDETVKTVKLDKKAKDELIDTTLKAISDFNKSIDEFMGDVSPQQNKLFHDDEEAYGATPEKSAFIEAQVAYDNAIRNIKKHRNQFPDLKETLEKRHALQDKTRLITDGPKTAKHMQRSTMPSPFSYSPVSMDNPDGTMKKKIEFGELVPSSNVTDIMKDVNRELWKVKIGELTFAELRIRDLKFNESEKKIALLHESRIKKMDKTALKAALLEIDPTVSDFHSDEEARIKFLEFRSTLIRRLDFNEKSLDEFTNFLKTHLLQNVDQSKKDFLADSIAHNFHQSGIAVAVASYFSMKVEPLMEQERMLENHLKERVTGFDEPERMVVINCNALGVVTFDSTVTFNKITTERDSQSEHGKKTISLYMVAECGLRLMSKKPTSDEQKRLLPNTIYLYKDAKGEPRYVVKSSKQEHSIKELSPEYRQSIYELLEQNPLPSNKLYLRDFYDDAPKKAVESLFNMALKRDHTGAAGKVPICEIKGKIKITAEPTASVQNNFRAGFKLKMKSDPLTIQKRIMRDGSGKPAPSLNLFLSKLLDNPLSGTAGVYLQNNKPDPEKCKPLALYLYFDDLDKNTLKYMAVKQDGSSITGKVPTHKKAGIFKKEMVLTKQDIQNIKTIAPKDPEKLTDLIKGSGFRLMLKAPTPEDLARDDNVKIYLYLDPNEGIKYFHKEGKTEYTVEGLSPEDTATINKFFKTRQILIRDGSTLYLSERGNENEATLKALNALFAITSKRGHTQAVHTEALKTVALAVSTLDYTPPNFLARFSNLFISKKKGSGIEPKPTVPSAAVKPDGFGRGPVK